jgi:hypothetical protein
MHVECCGTASRLCIFVIFCVLSKSHEQGISPGHVTLSSHRELASHVASRKTFYPLLLTPTMIIIRVTRSAVVEGDIGLGIWFAKEFARCHASPDLLIREKKRIRMGHSVPPEEAAAKSSGTEFAESTSILKSAACNAMHVISSRCHWSKQVVCCAIKIPTDIRSRIGTSFARWGWQFVFLSVSLTEIYLHCKLTLVRFLGTCKIRKFGYIKVRNGYEIRWRSEMCIRWPSMVKKLSLDVAKSMTTEDWFWLCCGHEKFGNYRRWHCRRVGSRLSIHILKAKRIRYNGINRTSLIQFC